MKKGATSRRVSTPPGAISSVVIMGKERGFSSPSTAPISRSRVRDPESLCTRFSARDNVPLELAPKRATALEFEPLRATVVQRPFHRCATAGDTTAEQGRGTLVDPEISYAGNALISVIARPVFAKRPCASVRGAPGGSVVFGDLFFTVQ